MQDQVVVDTAGTGGRIVASVLETWPGDTRKLTWQPLAYWLQNLSQHVASGIAKKVFNIYIYIYCI